MRALVLVLSCVVLLAVVQASYSRLEASAEETAKDAARIHKHPEHRHRTSDTDRVTHRTGDTDRVTHRTGDTDHVTHRKAQHGDVDERHHSTENNSTGNHKEMIGLDAGLHSSVPPVASDTNTLHNKRNKPLLQIDKYTSRRTQNKSVSRSDNWRQVDSNDVIGSRTRSVFLNEDKFEKTNRSELSRVESSHILEHNSRHINNNNIASGFSQNIFQRRNRHFGRHSSAKRNSCSLDSDCKGNCCVKLKNGKSKCISSRKEIGQQCASSCVCKAGLKCFANIYEERTRSHSKLIGRCVAADLVDHTNKGFLIPPEI